eukprot:scaffold36743_cov65-Phaeocystis_antarctica.AAC.2
MASAVKAVTVVIVHAVAPSCWALARSFQRCTATRAPRPRTRVAVITTSVAKSDASPLLTASEKVTNSPSQIISAIATMWNGIIIRNTLDLYATVCSESANLPVNRWIGGSVSSVSGLSSFSGSSLRAWSRGNSAEQELSVGAGIRLDWSRALAFNCGPRCGTVRPSPCDHGCGPNAAPCGVLPQCSSLECACVPYAPLRPPGTGPAASSPSRAPRPYQPPPNHVKAAGHVGLWGRVEHTHRSHFGFADFEGTANGAAPDGDISRALLGLHYVTTKLAHLPAHLLVARERRWGGRRRRSVRSVEGLGAPSASPRKPRRRRRLRRMPVGAVPGVRLSGARAPHDGRALAALGCGSPSPQNGSGGRLGRPRSPPRRCGGRFRGLGRRRATGGEPGLEAVQAALEPLEVVLEPLPRRVEVVGLQEGMATEQRIEVTEGMHDDEKDEREVECEQVATHDSPGG